LVAPGEIATQAHEIGYRLGRPTRAGGESEIVDAPLIKVCLRCGDDVARKPRYRDPEGRYWCEGCYDKARAVAKEPRSAPASAVAARSAHEPDENPPPGLVETTIALADPVVQPPTRAPCPVCGNRLVPGVPACAACGYDPAKVPLALPPSPGRKPKRPKRGAFSCKECGYDLAGVPPNAQGRHVCPECGIASKPPARRRDWDEETSRQVARGAVRKPLFLLIGGLAAAAIIVALTGQPALFLVYLIQLAASFAVGFVAVLCCCLIWIGFPNTLRLMVLQIAAIHAITGIILGLLTAVPIIPRWVGMALFGWTYAYMLADLMDIDVGDSWIVAVVVVVSLVASIFVLNFVFL